MLENKQHFNLKLSRDDELKNLFIQKLFILGLIFNFDNFFDNFFLNLLNIQKTH
jgi:hypothetical protein